MSKFNKNVFNESDDDKNQRLKEMEEIPIQNSNGANSLKQLQEEEKV